MSAPHRHVLLAPGAAGSRTVHAPGAEERLPAVDDRLVAPESRFEAIDGVLIETMGANEPHATANGEIVFVLRAAAKSGFRCAVDMLTRADRYSDTAPDASIFPEERTAEGGRKLEELVFEIRDTQSLSDVTRKAELLAARGVRRIFCLEVKAGRVLEWSKDEEEWRELPIEGEIEDSVLATPIPVRALLDAAEADNAAARALLAKGNPIIEEALTRSRAAGHTEGHKEGHKEGREEGREEGLVRGIEVICELLGIAIDEPRRVLLKTLDASDLERLLSEIRSTRSWPQGDDA